MNGGGSALANVKIYGLDRFAGKLSRLSAETEQIVGKGLHDGAAVMADRIKAGIAGIRTDGPSDWERQRREKQKAGLSESFGIARMQNDGGFLNVKMGFDGYNSVTTPKYPTGQPNVMVARMFNSGTSSMSKQVFFDQAVNASRAAAKNTAVQKIEQEFEKINKE